MKTPKRVGSTLSHDRAPKQERGIAKRLGGDLVPRSGAGPVKGDVRVHGVVRIEAKTTAKKSFAITHHLVDQIEEAAVATGEIPVAQVQFINEQGTVTRSVCIVPDWVLEEVVAYGLAKKRGAAGDGAVPDLGADAAEPAPERTHRITVPVTIPVPRAVAQFDTRPQFSRDQAPDWDDPAPAGPGALKARKADGPPRR